MFKRFFYIILVVLPVLISVNELRAQCGEPLVEICYPKLGDSKYLNSFPVRLKKSKRGEPPTVMKQSLILNSGTKYRFAIVNAEEYEGKLIMNLYSSQTLVGTSVEYSTGKYFDIVEYNCKKAGIYYLTFYFEDGKEGCGLCLMGQKEWKGK